MPSMGQMTSKQPLMIIIIWMHQEMMAGIHRKSIRWISSYCPYPMLLKIWKNKSGWFLFVMVPDFYVPVVVAVCWIYMEE
jgi:hypothetical protein